MVRHSRLWLLRSSFLALTVVAVSTLGMAQAPSVPTHKGTRLTGTPEDQAQFVSSISAPGITRPGTLPSPIPSIAHAQAFAISQPVRDLATLSPDRDDRLHGAREVRSVETVRAKGLASLDRAEQKVSSSPGDIVTGINVPGIGNGFLNYSVSDAPPDANLAVGDTQVVQWVNVSFAVFDKATGAAGPAVLGKSLWSALGGPCASNNSGQPIVQWDRTAHRWLLTQNVLAAPFTVCVAVSQSPDANGPYYLYQFAAGTGYPDYTKWGIWPTGYFQTMNNLGPDGHTPQGAKVCGYNSVKLLAGDGSAEQICFQLSNADTSLLPADLDSPTSSPAGQDEFFIGGVGAVDNTHLSVYSAHVDFASPQNSTFTGNGNNQLIAIAPFTLACNGDFVDPCVPQKDVTDMLQSSGDRLMYRFAYYNDDSRLQFPPRQHWYVNFDVAASGGQSAVRWMELAASEQIGGPTGMSVFQQGTFAPDSNWRWMGSVARDSVGDILLGYSESSDVLFPSIFIAGRKANDPLGTLETELAVVNGSGSQVGTSGAWGAYSSMRLDPSDLCTFWYTAEYYVSTTSLDWSTRIVSAKFPNCAGNAQILPTQTTLNSSPNPSTVNDPVTLTATVTPQTNIVGAFDIIAGAAPLFTDLGSGNQVYQCCQGWTVSGLGTLGTSFTAANRFTATASGDVTQIDVAVGYVAGVNSFYVALYTDNGGMPGNLLGEWTDLTSGINFPGCCGLVTIPGITGVTLTAGDSLFLVLGPNDLNDSSFLYWNLNNQSVTGLDLYSTDGGNTWNQNVNGTPTGTVAFSNGNNPIPECPQPVTISGGVATCVTQSLPAGTDCLTASYSGDVNYASSSGQACQTVQPSASLTTETSSANPSNYRAPVTFTATVAAPVQGPFSPTGTVTFTSDGASIPECSLPVTLTGGQAACTTLSLAIGVHTIKACYSGDSNFQPSCGQVTQVVNPAATTVTVTSAPNPSQFNHSVVITALVNGAPGGPLPSGTVTFTDRFNGIQSTLCAGVPLHEPGVAVCTTTVLTCGTHSQLVASYSGDQNYSPSNGSDNPPQVVVGCGDFTVLPISPGTVEVTQTFTNNNDPFHAQAINVTVQPVSGYTGSVRLSCSVSSPFSGGSCTVNPPTSGSLAGGNLSTTLTISAGGSTPTGNYTVTVLAQDDTGLMHTATLGLTVDEKTPGVMMVTGGPAPPVPVVFGPGPGVVHNPSCPLVTGTGINGTEDFGLIGGVCSFNQTTTTLPDPVVVSITGCTIAQLRGGTRIYASLWFGLPGVVLLGSFRRRARSGRKLLRLLALFLAVSILLIGMGCGGVGQTTPDGSYLVLVQGTGADGTVYSAVIPVTVKPLGQ